MVANRQMMWITVMLRVTVWHAAALAAGFGKQLGRGQLSATAAPCTGIWGEEGGVVWAYCTCR
jgi:hypothetical protein